MKLLINTSTLSGTGVTQVAVSFLTECIKFPSHQYEVFLSKSVNENINTALFPNNFHFYIFDKSPLKSPRVRSRCKELYNRINPDCVFSIFGPSYWTPDVPHLQGYAYPHYVYPESPLFGIIPIKERIRIFIYKHLHKFFLKRNGEYYVSETEDVSTRLQNFLKIDADKIFTVSNTYNKNVFNNNNDTLHLNKDEFKLLSLCSPYLHKNLSIINSVVNELENAKPQISIKFVVTIDESSYNSIFTDKAKKYIQNIGPVAIKDCPKLYQSCDAIFLPTLLECFSANYPEAMIMKRPILTSNLPFAKCVCKDAALYFDPMNPKDIAQKIIFLAHTPKVYKSLVSKGLAVINSIPTSEERARQYLSICEFISNK